MTVQGVIGIAGGQRGRQFIVTAVEIETARQTAEPWHARVAGRFARIFGNRLM